MASFEASLHVTCWTSASASFAEDFDFAHVADVKQAGGGARRHVLGHNARVLDGHVPAAKVDHLGF